MKLGRRRLFVEEDLNAFVSARRTEIKSIPRNELVGTPRSGLESLEVQPEVDNPIQTTEGEGSGS